MPRIRLAKLNDAYVRKWQAQNRERAVHIREQTLRAAREGTPLAPIMQDQHDFIFSGVNRVWKETTEPSAAILGEQVLGVLSGSYSRGSPVIGADLDLDFLYDNNLYSQLYPVERVIVEHLAQLFDFPVAAIHPHLSFVVQMHFPQREYLWQPFALERAIIRWDQKLARARKRRPRFPIGTQQKYAVRDYQRILALCLAKARGRYMPEELDSFLNWGFAFGNERNFKDFTAARDSCLAETAKDLEVIKRENSHLLFQVSWNIRKASDRKLLQSSTSSLKKFIKYLKKNALFYYTHLCRLEEYLGAEIITSPTNRETAASAVEMLQKIRAVTCMEMFPHSQSVGPTYDSSPIPKEVLERVAGHFGGQSTDSLFGLILEQTKTIAQIANDTQQAFFNLHNIEYN